MNACRRVIIEHVLRFTKIENSTMNKAGFW